MRELNLEQPHMRWREWEAGPRTDENSCTIDYTPWLVNGVYGSEPASSSNWTSCSQPAMKHPTRKNRRLPCCRAHLSRWIALDPIAAWRAGIPLLRVLSEETMEPTAMLVFVFREHAYTVSVTGERLEVVADALIDDALLSSSAAELLRVGELTAVTTPMRPLAIATCDAIVSAMAGRADALVSVITVQQQAWGLAAGPQLSSRESSGFWVESALTRPWLMLSYCMDVVRFLDGATLYTYGENGWHQPAAAKRTASWHAEAPLLALPSLLSNTLALPVEK